MYDNNWDRFWSNRKISITLEKLVFETIRNIARLAIYKAMEIPLSQISFFSPCFAFWFDQIYLDMEGLVLELELTKFFTCLRKRFCILIAKYELEI